MTDPAKKLRAMYAPANRYANFGPVIRRMIVNGFRGVDNLEVRFDFPVSAISGLNGAGKSTVGQLSLSGYRKPTTSQNYNRFYVRDFFPASIADPNPFHANSSVLYEYETDVPDTPQELTVRRSKVEWSGYKRQPERKCFYVGFTIYIPKVERKDASIYRGRDIALTDQRLIPDEVRAIVGRILGQQYDGLHFQGISHGKKNAELGIATRFGGQYSENNMGFGEGRTLYLVDLLENSPEQSLFVIEEPETSLHVHAQYELGKYLLDVARRRHHQIVISTHSDRVLAALPVEARILLHRDKTGVAAFPGLSATRFRALLSLGRDRGLVVFVEDEFAKALLMEIVRVVAPTLLQAIDIQAVGSNSDVRQAVLLVSRIGQNCMAVRDADSGPDPQNAIYSFPGTQPPEREVFECESVIEEMQAAFGLDVTNALNLAGVDNHHDIVDALAIAADALPDYLMCVAIKAYVASLGPDVFAPAIDEIRQRA